MIQDVSRISPPRLALVSGNLYLGGVTTFLCNVGGELVRRNIPVQVLSFDRNNPLASDFRRGNVPVQCQDHRRLIFEDRLVAVLRELSRFQPTVVLANLSASSFEVLRYLPAGILRVGVSQSDHATIYEMMQHYAPYMDLLAVVSENMKRKLGAAPGLSRIPLAYLPYGVPFPSDVRAGRHDANHPLRILYLGRLIQAQKRVRCFPTILEWLKASSIPFHWTLAGEGPEREYLERTMTGSRTQTLSFLGKVAYADVPSLLSKQDILLLASDHEGLPLSLLEAMGHGVVPVISDLESGVREVVDAGNGMLIPVDDIEGYARAIIHLHGHREELAAKSAAARERVKRDFSVEAMTDRWLAVLPKNCPKVEWPTRWKIRPMLVARHPFYFSPLMRVLRRLVMRFRS